MTIRVRYLSVWSTILEVIINNYKVALRWCRFLFWVVFPAGWIDPTNDYPSLMCQWSLQAIQWNLRILFSINGFKPFNTRKATSVTNHNNPTLPEHNTMLRSVISKFGKDRCVCILGLQPRNQGLEPMKHLVPWRPYGDVFPFIPPPP